MRKTSSPPIVPNDQAPTPEVLATILIIRKARVSQHHAATIAHLAGLGTYREGATR